MKLALFFPIALTLLSHATQEPASKPAAKVTADALKGKVVCFVFRSIQCPIMIANEHKLIALHQDLKANNNVLVVAVNANAGELGEVPAEGAKDSYPRIRRCPKDHDMTFSVLADQLAARTTPHSYVFDQEVILRYAGGFDDDPKANKEKPVVHTRDAIDAGVAGKDVKVPTTEAWGCTIKRVAASRRGDR